MIKNDEDLSACVDKVREDSPLVSARLSPAVLASLESENESLREEARMLREELDRQKSQQEKLKRRLEDVEASTSQLLCQYLEAQQQNNNLANLYVASYRLHETKNREEGLAVIQEIIINLIGSEELAIFELEREDSVLSLISSFGVETPQFQTIPVGSGLIGCTAVSGESYLAGRTDIEGCPPDKLDLTACVPLRLNGKVWGVIAIFSLLQQKNGLETADYELLELLATQAAVAIHCTGLPAETDANSEAAS